jgi:glycosyltransferase involved in cell wall biosynthesis
VDRDAALQRKLEFSTLRRADACYAPSYFVADHYQRLLGITVGTVRTPSERLAGEGVSLPFQLPSKFLLFYGQMIARKGIELLIEAAKKAFEIEPDLQWVFVGAGDPSYVTKLLGTLEQYRSQVTVLYPLPHVQMMSVVKQAHAAVLPSLVDNLPNTAIECLSNGIPVIGPRGVSFDEIVEDGVTGRLVSINDANELCEAIINCWRDTETYKKGFNWSSTIANSFSIRNSISEFEAFCSKYLENKN